jgi:hypothetical protein
VPTRVATAQAAGPALGVSASHVAAPGRIRSSRAAWLLDRARRRALPTRTFTAAPGWPLVLLFGGFPIWWIFGLGVLGPVIAAVPMSYYLLKLRHVRIPGGFSLWLLFLAWVVAGVTVLWVQPSGTAPVAGLGRLVPYGYRLTWYLVATIVLLYVGNIARSTFSDRRIYRLLGWMFLITIAGGYVGFLAPDLPLRSVLEIVVPAGLRSNSFLSLLIHPTVALIQDIGVIVTRPSAPFIYANDWGANAGLLAPFFVLSWTGRGAGWRRKAFPVVALISIPPLVFSLNRGLWLGLGAATVFVAVRLAASGRFAAVGGVVAGLVLLAVLIPTTPLGGLVSERLANQHSNEGRSELAVRAVESAFEESPIIGFGGSRAVAGNFYSIAGGKTAECPSCSPPQIGTQGHLWLLIFGHGLGGALFFLAFFVRRFVAGLRDHSRDAVALCAVIVFYFTVMFVYDLLTMATFVAMIAFGVLWRRETEPVPTATVLTTKRRRILRPAVAVTR